MAKKSAAHIGLHESDIACFHCGARVRVIPKGGLPIDMLLAASKGFEKTHAGCKETPNSPTLKLEEDEEEWQYGLFVGSSSATIFASLAGWLPSGIARDRIGALPQDPDDFSRCHRLLRIKPEWRARLGEVAAKHKAWAPLVEHWDELTAMFERKDSGMYDRMQVLSKGSTRA